MTEKTKQTAGSSSINDAFTYSDSDLQATLDRFMDKHPAREHKKENLWNLQMMIGLAFVFLTLSFILEGVLSGSGLVPGLNLSGIMNALPVIGGVLVLATGFGFFTRERRLKKQHKHAVKQRRKKAYAHFNTSETKENRTWEGGFSRSVRAESYALHRHKKLTRSRKGRKCFGVCGGIANYFGVSATFVRLMFVIATLLGYGFPIILYLAMAIVVPKEPVLLAG